MKVTDDDIMKNTGESKEDFQVDMNKFDSLNNSKPLLNQE